MRELLVLAETAGASKAELETTEEAEKFRFALYHFRKQENLGLDLLVSVNGNQVSLTKKASPKIEIVSNGDF
jgi:hypothetical protein